MIKGFSVTQVLTASGVTLSPSNVWNSGGTTFTGILFNVTDTASAAGSLLLDLQTGGTTRFNVRKDGRVLAGDGLAYAFVSAPTTGIGRLANDIALYSGATPTARLFSTGFAVSSDQFIGFASGAINATTQDTTLFRDAADTIAQRRGTNAQTKRIYGTFTDTSNYRRVAIAMTTGGVASIAPEGAGTGASGNVLHISGLPTSNPGAGILWNDAGTVKVGT